MRYTVERSTIEILGKIWMPAGALCAQEKVLSRYDLDNARDEAGKWTKDSVERWLMLHSGDFSEIVDWRADFTQGEENFVREWQDEESEFKYADAMYPVED